MKKAILYGGAALAGLICLTVGWLTIQLHRYPSLLPYEQLFIPLSPVTANSVPGMKVAFFGVSTLLFDDGETAFLTDGFFSRPPLFRLGHVSPDREMVTGWLQRANIKRLSAVIPVHSHYDHALDSALVAELTGATLIGSKSTAYIGRGGGLPEDRIRIVGSRDTVRIGRFKVTFIESAHSPGDRAEGEILAPVRAPIRANAYKTGTCFTLLVEHGTQSVLVQSSAGFTPGALSGRHADIVFLGIGGLGTQSDKYREAYWRETVSAVGARRILLIHWDDMWRPLDLPLVPMPRLFDDFDMSLHFLMARARQEGVEVRIPKVAMSFDPTAAAP